MHLAPHLVADILPYIVAAIVAAVGPASALALALALGQYTCEQRRRRVGRARRVAGGAAATRRPPLRFSPRRRRLDTPHVPWTTTLARIAPRWLVIPPTPRLRGRVPLIFRRAVGGIISHRPVRAAAGGVAWRGGGA
eukprot:scaffold89158_cov34-Phaeocystis_antarctica.AAC.4